MRLIPLHNSLYIAAKLLRADVAAVKLIPDPGATWTGVDLVVGDTGQLPTLNWGDGNEAPSPTQSAFQADLFGIENVLQFYPSDLGDNLLARVQLSDELLNAMPGQFTYHERRGISRAGFGCLWFAIATDNPDKMLNLEWLHSDDVRELAFGIGTQVMWGLYQSAHAHADPVTALPGPIEFRQRLSRLCDPVRTTGPEESSGGFILILLALDDFIPRRRRLGPEHTDQLLHRSARLLENALRKDDGLFQYSDAQFAVLAEIADADHAQPLAHKLVDALDELQQGAEFADAHFSIGYIFQEFASEALDAQVLNLCAEQALDRARLLGGHRAVAFEGDFNSDEATNHLKQSSVFTANPARDYRNQHLLWNTMSLVAAETDAQQLCTAFCHLLQETLGTGTTMLLDIDKGSLFSLADPSAPINIRLSPERQHAVRQALEQRRTQVRDIRGEDNTWFATPLIAREQSYGCLFIESQEGFPTSDQVFLKGLADQVAGALDRANLVESQILKSSAESRSLRAQLNNLQQNIAAAPAPVMVSDAPSMQKVMDYVQRIAPTDVSVLIMGESGAGKEVMARSIHAASDRAEAPLITVDCSAIAHTLIDSELFGRVKGAFTGADAASTGRIAQAQGGTLFLDEIGELPLDVQAKLLRFVQEKQLTAVGDVQPQVIDTRIICATNRNLLAEVEAGNFRGDLYYRLQAIQVHVPPLRERKEDLARLVEGFVTRYAEQFDRKLSGLTQTAWHKLQAYSWPGNIRELQNTILRASLVADGEQIDAHDLSLSGDNAQHAGSVPESMTGTATEHYRAPPSQGHPPAVPTAPDQIAASGVYDGAAAAPNAGTDDDSWSVLSSLLRAQAEALYVTSGGAGPLGRWFNDTVVIVAWEQSNRVTRAAGRLLGIAETTLRRQLQKAQQAANNSLQITSPQWQASQPALHRLLTDIMNADRPAASEPALMDRLQQALLQEVSNLVGSNVPAGAELMGITTPTYNRWLEKFNITMLPPSAAVRAHHV